MNDEIKGSGKDYYAAMNSDAYRAKINTPAKNPEYFRQFHQPLAERAKQKFGRPIKVLDIAVGPGDEMDFFKDDPDVQIFATDISESVLSGSKGLKSRLPQSDVFVSDVKHRAIAKNSMDAGVLLNAMIYDPEKMLETMHESLKPGAECSVNFRVFNNPNNKVFYDYYLSHGGKILDQKLNIKGKEFNVKILDYTQCVNDDGTPDLQIRQLVQQIYFQSEEDVSELIKASSFEEVGHSRFNFASPVNPDNQIDVFTLRKPEK